MKVSYKKEKQHNTKKNVIFFSFLIVVVLATYITGLLFFFTMWVVSMIFLEIAILLMLKFLFGTDYLGMIIFNLRKDH